MNRTPRRRARRGSGELLRGEILSATRELMAETGSIEEVSIRAVAERVGVTSPSIYLHFADKDALLDAVVADVFTDLDQRMNADVADRHGMDKICEQGMAYIRFALETPTCYLLATTQARTESGTVDMVLGTSAFAHFLETIEECIADGLFAPGDPTAIAIELWAAAHGIASLMIAKPYLPWGDRERVAYNVMRAAGIGHSMVNYLGDDIDPTGFTTWRATLPPNPTTNPGHPDQAPPRR